MAAGIFGVGVALAMTSDKHWCRPSEYPPGTDLAQKKRRTTRLYVIIRDGTGTLFGLFDGNFVRQILVRVIQMAEPKLYSRHREM